MTNTKEMIEQFALGLGFDEVRFAQAQALDNEYQKYSEWIAKGYHADMQYLENYPDKRHDIRLMLDGAKTVLVLAHNYRTNHLYNQDKGKLARYSWGDDYHDIIKDKLNSISEFIKNEFDKSCKVCVDTAPVMERQWAVRSGLGWQGKNGNIINSRFGSFFFIGIIITDLELAPDSQTESHCGTCKRCINACPTGAIVSPGVIDSNKCISYWTIEAKPDKEIPQPIADNISGRVFGCDICQEVCPWNAKQIFTTENRFSPRNGETCLSTEYIEQMTQEDFSLRFRKSAIKRTKLAGLKRNTSLLKEKDQNN